jgi:hypothetical protein
LNSKKREKKTEKIKGKNREIVPGQLLHNSAHLATSSLPPSVHLACVGRALRHATDWWGPRSHLPHEDLTGARGATTTMNVPPIRISLAIRHCVRRSLPFLFPFSLDPSLAPVVRKRSLAVPPPPFVVNRANSSSPVVDQGGKP